MIFGSRFARFDRDSFRDQIFKPVEFDKADLKVSFDLPNVTATPKPTIEATADAGPDFASSSVFGSVSGSGLISVSASSSAAVGANGSAASAQGTVTVGNQTFTTSDFDFFS